VTHLLAERANVPVDLDYRIHIGRDLLEEHERRFERFRAAPAAPRVTPR